MSKKMGRPKVPKAKLRGIIVNARLSPEESKTINAAAVASGEPKSEWIRKTLLSAASSSKKDS